MSETLQPAVPVRRPWWKRILRFLLWISGGFVALLLLAVLLTVIFEDKIKGYVLSEINQYLNTTIYIDTQKDVNLTVIRTFPQVSVEFNNITALDATTKSTRDTLFQAGRIDLRFNILDFFKSNYTIRHIAVADAQLDLRTDKQGNDNYHFLKTDTTSKKSDTSSVAFALEKIEFTNVHARWRDQRDRSDYSLTLNETTCAGDFGSEKYLLSATSTFTIENLERGDASWFAGNTGSLTVDLNIDNPNNRYTINTCKVQVSDLKTNLTGSITELQSGYQLDLGLKGDEVDIPAALSLLPASLKKDLEGLTSTGEFYVDASVKGLMNDSAEPIVEASFGVRDQGTLARKGTGVTLTNITVEGKFSNDPKASGLHISKFNAQTKTSKFSGTFDLNNLKRPEIHTRFDGHVDLSELQQIVQIDTIETLSGTLDVHVDTRGKPGKNGSITTADLKQFQTSGEVRFTQMVAKLKNALLPIDSVNGALLFDGNTVSMRNFRARSGASDFAIDGSLRNFLPWLLTDKTTLDVTANCTARNIDFNSLLGTTSTTKGDTAYKLVFPERIQCTIHSKVDHVIFRKFDAYDLSGDLVLRNRRLVADPIRFRAMDGEITGSGMIDGTALDSLLVTGSADLEHVNVTKMFTQMENFGQDEITEKNIKGTLTSTINFASVWGADLGVDERRIFAQADVKLDRGELNEFEPLNILARFIRLDDLSHLRFSTLTNTIEIRNRVITIPAMDIASNAVDLTMSGTHDFDNVVDYHFRIELDEVHARKMFKAKKENEEFGQVEEDGGHRFSLYVSMKGPLDNPEVKYYNLKDALKNVKQDIKQEKQNLKTILREEFGWFKKDTTLNTNGKPTDKKNDDEKFIIRWNDDGKKKEEDLESSDDF